MRVGQQGTAAEFLAANALFAGLGHEAVGELASAAEPFVLNDGERLFAQNDRGDGAYLVAEGTLVASARTPGDGHRELARVGPGGVLGEFNLLDGGLRSAEVAAEGAVRGYRLDYQRFAALLAGRRPAAFALVERLRGEVARRIAATTAGLGEPGGGGVGAAENITQSSADAAECARLLGPFPGFDRFSPEDWRDFAYRTTRIEAARGTALASAGTRREVVYVVARGALRELLGERQLLVYGPGALAGNAAVLCGGEWPTRLEAREDAIVLALPRSEVAALDPDDELAAKLLTLVGPQLTRDLRRLSRVGNRALDPALETA